MIFPRYHKKHGTQQIEKLKSREGGERRRKEGGRWYWGSMRNEGRRKKRKEK